MDWWTTIAVLAGIVLVVTVGLLRRAGVVWATWILLGVLIIGAVLIYRFGGDTSAWFTFVLTVMTGALILAFLQALRRRREQKADNSDS